MNCECLGRFHWMGRAYAADTCENKVFERITFARQRLVPRDTDNELVSHCCCTRHMRIKQNSSAVAAGHLFVGNFARWHLDELEDIVIDALSLQKLRWIEINSKYSQFLISAPLKCSLCFQLIVRHFKLDKRDRRSFIQWFHENQRGNWNYTFLLNNWLQTKSKDIWLKGVTGSENQNG